MVEGCRLDLGEKVIVEEDESIINIIDKNIVSQDVSEEIVSSVDISVSWRGGGRSLREDFSVLFDILCLFCAFLSIFYIVYVPSP